MAVDMEAARGRACTMRSMALYTSSPVMVRPSRRTASSAASLSTLASSAPERPGRSRATCSRSTPGSSGLLRAWICGGTGTLVGVIGQGWGHEGP